MEEKSYWSYIHIYKSKFLRNDILAGVASTEDTSTVSKDTMTGQERDKRMHCNFQARDVKLFEISTQVS